MNLTKSIYSHTTGKLLGRQYEVVMIISQRDDVMIVEGVNGRFPVHCDHVTERLPDDRETIPSEPEREKATRLPAKKSKAAVKEITNTLFELGF
jgi:hypothetical protein